MMTSNYIREAWSAEEEVQQHRKVSMGGFGRVEYDLVRAPLVCRNGME